MNVRRFDKDDKEDDEEYDVMKMKEDDDAIKMGESYDDMAFFWNLIFHVCNLLVICRAGNESNQLENSSRLDSIIDSLNLVHEPNESNLS